MREPNHTKSLHREVDLTTKTTSSTKATKRYGISAGLQSRQRGTLWQIASDIGAGASGGCVQPCSEPTTASYQPPAWLSASRLRKPHGRTCWLPALRASSQAHCRWRLANTSRSALKQIQRRRIYN